MIHKHCVNGYLFFISCITCDLTVYLFSSSLASHVIRQYIYNLMLCCTDMAMLKWTRHVDIWQILKNTHNTCVGHVSNTTWLHDRSVRATNLMIQIDKVTRLSQNTWYKISKRCTPIGKDTTRSLVPYNVWHGHGFKIELCALCYAWSQSSL